MVEVGVLAEAEIYSDARTSFVKLIESLPEEIYEKVVPACPRWTVHDIVAHLIGASADFTSGNFPGQDVSFEDWTRNQVERGHGKSVRQLLADWDELAPTVKTMIAEGSVSPGPIISDTVVHELDIRGLARLPEHLDSHGFRYAYRRQMDGLEGRIKEANLPGLVVKTENLERKLGPGEPEASVEVSTYEFSRALMSRRSRRQVAAFGWMGNCTPYQDVLAPHYPGGFWQPEEDVLEG